jgi:hypothetical protein
MLSSYADYPVMDDCRLDGTSQVNRLLDTESKSTSSQALTSATISRLAVQILLFPSRKACGADFDFLYQQITLKVVCSRVGERVCLRCGSTLLGLHQAHDLGAQLSGPHRPSKPSGWLASLILAAGGGTGTVPSP